MAEYDPAQEQAVILGCGYVGQRVAQQWEASGVRVTATTTTASKQEALAAIATDAVVVRGDDAAALESLLANKTVLLVSVGAPNRQHYRETYIDTAQTLAQVLPHTTVNQIIYTGSFAVYGNHGGHWVTEDTAIAPTSDRTQLMADTEQQLLNAASDCLTVCVLRLGGIYGPGRELRRIFSRAAGTTLDGDGKSPSNWIHVDDIVGAIDFARRHRLSGIYNVVQDEILTRRDLMARVCQTYSLEPISWNPAVPSQRPHNVQVSNQKLKEAGYRFKQPQFWLPTP